MKHTPHRLPRRATVWLAVSMLFTGATVRAQDDMEHGNVWSRIIEHFDGKITKSFKDPDKRRVIEEKYDNNHVMLQKRLFQFDEKDRLRNGVIMDAKGNALGTTKYGYDAYDRINEERLFNAKGQCIQRKFPPGTLNPKDFPANVKFSVSFTVDPNHPNALGKMNATSDPIIQPTNSAEEAFTPGVPIGQQQSSGSGMPDTPPAPNNRKPTLIPIKKQR